MKNWRLILFLLFIILFFIILFISAHNHDNKNKSINDEKIEIPENEKVNNKNEDDEHDRKIEIISQVFGNHQIKFAEQDLKLEGFFNPEDNVLSVYYSDDAFSNQPKNEIAIFQYRNKISASELFNKELLSQVKNFYNPKYIKSYYHENDYFIVFSDSYDNYLSASLFLIKIFEKDGRTYKISYEKNIKDDVLNLSRSWVDVDYETLVDEFKDIDAFAGIDLSYAQKVLDDSVKIKNDLAKPNIYSNVKWETKTLKENGPHADINLEYPEFKGFAFANDLNRVINNVVLGKLGEDRQKINDLIKENKLEHLDNTKEMGVCSGDPDYDYECSVNLYSSFKVGPIINDIISIEIILTDYTGGGNGDHSYPKTIIYDLKNRKQLFLDDLFCGDDYLDRIKEILIANQLVDPVFGSSYLSDEILLSDLAEASFNDFGLTLSFRPYIFTPGSYGIYNVFTPYILIEKNICFNKDKNKNADILIRRSLLNLNVPGDLSDSCGFMTDNCEGFRFYEGEFNKIDSYNFNDEKASISVLFNSYTIGNLLSGNKNERIVITPYHWQSVSGGYGIYVLKVNDDDLDLIARIGAGKKEPKNLEIKNNKIYYILQESESEGGFKQSCYFKNNKLEEKSLICE